MFCSCSCPSSSWLGAHYYASSQTRADGAAILWPRPLLLPHCLLYFSHLLTPWQEKEKESSGGSNPGSEVFVLKHIWQNWLYGHIQPQGLRRQKAKNIMWASWMTAPLPHSSCLRPLASGSPPCLIKLWHKDSMGPLVSQPCQVFPSLLPKRMGHNSFKYVKDFKTRTDPQRYSN